MAKFPRKGFTAMPHECMSKRRRHGKPGNLSLNLVSHHDRKKDVSSESYPFGNTVPGCRQLNFVNVFIVIFNVP